MALLKRIVPLYVVKSVSTGNAAPEAHSVTGDIGEPSAACDNRVIVGTAKASEFPSPEEPEAAASPEEPEAGGLPDKDTFKPGVVESFLNNSGLLVISKSIPVSNKGIAGLSEAIAGSLPHAQSLMQAMRSANTTSERAFSLTLTGLSGIALCKIIMLAEMMKNCGIFTEYFCPDNKFIKAKMSSSPKVINFINGEWLEIYAQQLTLSVISDFAERRGMDWELYSNVTVENPSTHKHHEIDLLFSIGNVVFGSEQKSGLQFIQYDKYRLVGEFLRIIPDRFILVNSTLTDVNAADTVHYLYGYYVSSIIDYRETLIKMIENSSWIR